MDGTRAGQVLAGRYELVELLGGAEVWRARDRRLGRTVVVKLAAAGMAEREAARFANELRLLAGARHPNVVTLYDAGTADGRPYLVMQDVPGGTLAEALADGPLTPGRVLDLAIGVADALRYLHAAGIAHRDLKPGNVLLDVGGRPHVADLGIARAVDAARLTGTGMVIGTPAYLAPEQVQGDLVTSKCDQYAFGLMLLECLTGRREYTGSSVEAAMARLSRPPRIPAALPAPWPGLIAELTAMRPADRPTATDVAARLRAVRGDDYSPATEQIVPPAVAADSADLAVTEEVGLAPAPAAVPVAAVPPPRRGHGRRWLVVAPAVTVAAGVGAVVAAAALRGGAVPEGRPDTVVTADAGRSATAPTATNQPVAATATMQVAATVPATSAATRRTPAAPTKAAPTKAAPTKAAGPAASGPVGKPAPSEPAGPKPAPAKPKKPKKPKK